MPTWRYVNDIHFKWAERNYLDNMDSVIRSYHGFINVLFFLSSRTFQKLFLITKYGKEVRLIAVSPINLTSFPYILIRVCLSGSFSLPRKSTPLRLSLWQCSWVSVGNCIMSQNINKRSNWTKRLLVPNSGLFKRIILPSNEKCTI